jgi:glucokinase
MRTDAAVLGFDIGGTRIRVALADASRVIATGATSWPPGLSAAEEMEHVADFALALAGERGKALAEWQFGAGRGYQNLLVLMAGTGVGCGLILNGSLFRGSNGWAGGLGHQVVLPDGLECPCGRRGCLQTLASGRALERSAASRNLPDAASLSRAAEGGQAWAIEEIAACGGWLGLAAANVVNLLDVEAVISALR